MVPPRRSSVRNSKQVEIANGDSISLILKRIDERGKSQTRLLDAHAGILKTNTQILGIQTETLKKHSEILTSIADSQGSYMSHMNKIVEDMGSIANSLKATVEQNRTLIESSKEYATLIAGKKQVPMSVFFLVVMFMTVTGWLVISYITKIAVTVEPSKIAIGATEHTK